MTRVEYLRGNMVGDDSAWDGVLDSAKPSLRPTSDFFLGVTQESNRFCAEMLLCTEQTLGKGSKQGDQLGGYCNNLSER